MDEFNGDLAQPKYHASAYAKGAMVVDVEFHGVSFVGCFVKKMVMIQ